MCVYPGRQKTGILHTGSDVGSIIEASEKRYKASEIAEAINIDVEAIEAIEAS